MSGVKHTPSELHAVFNGLYWDVAVGPHDYSQLVASCHANRVLGHDLKDAERHARLFAAAPDLLEALERSAEGWANALELKLIPPQHRVAATVLRDEARAAIARARGEQDGGAS